MEAPPNASACIPPFHTVAFAAGAFAQDSNVIVAPDVFQVLLMSSRAARSRRRLVAGDDTRKKQIASDEITPDQVEPIAI